MFSGCEGKPPPTSQPRAAIEPAPTQPAARTHRPTTAPATQPTTAPTTQPTRPAATQPTTQPTEAGPSDRPPDYLEIIEPVHPARATHLKTEAKPPSTVTIYTDNVRKLRIYRERTPLRRDRSIAIRIDDQAIEWLPGSPTLDLERSPAGDWNALSSKRP